MLAAISTGPETHLDHLAPLCFILDIPLIVTNLNHLEIGKKFYPMVEMQYVSLADLTLEYLATHFETLITCGKFWAMELKPKIKLFFNKELRFIFVPHGYSDKEVLLNSPVAQDIELDYASDLGNLRYWFYQGHKDHFDRLADPFFRSEKKTVLYAPTWKTTATSTSFFEKIDELIGLFAKDYQLLIKLHPLLEENNPAQFHRILGKHESDAHFIQNFPAIYPLLERIATYLGDYSSIGYDFLTYNRPLFFLADGGALNQCGRLLENSIESAQEELREVRERVYLKTFGRGCNPEKIKALFKRNRAKA